MKCFSYKKSRSKLDICDDRGVIRQIEIEIGRVTLEAFDRPLGKIAHENVIYRVLKSARVPFTGAVRAAAVIARRFVDEIGSDVVRVGISALAKRPAKRGSAIFCIHISNENYGAVAVFSLIFSDHLVGKLHLHNAHLVGAALIPAELGIGAVFHQR